MASPAKDAKTKHTADGFTDVSERGKGSLRSRKPRTEQYALTTQVGNVGWHFGDGPYDETHEVDTAWVDADPILDAPWQKKMVLADYNAYAFREPTLGFDQGQLIEYVHPASGEAVNFQPTQLQWANDLGQISPVEDPQAVAATIDDDILTWVDAYGSGIDFQWETQTARLMKYVNIASLADLGSPPQFIIDGGNPVLRVELLFQKSANTEIWVDGIEWDEKSNNPQETLNNVEFKLAGESLWWFKAPKAWDSSINDAISPLMRIRQSATNLFVEILTPWVWLETASYPLAIDVTIEDQVAGSADDACQKLNGGMVIDTSTPYWQGGGDGSGIYDYIGARWAVAGPASGDTVDVCYAEYYSNSSSFDDADGNLDFEAADDPPEFSNGGDATNISDRTLTGSTVLWDETGFGTGFVDTPSLATPCQAIINRGGWASGNAMVITGDALSSAAFQWENYDSSSSNAAKLHIEYTAAAGGINLGVAFHHLNKNIGR